MNLRGVAISGLLWLLVAGCTDATEAPRVELPVTVDRAGTAAVTTDLGYEVELTGARVVWQNLVFTVAGEVHVNSGFWERVSDVLVPAAHAHPGHFQGGEVTGELLGTHVFDWAPGAAETTLGQATLLAGKYTAANVGLGRATEADVEAGDPLLGHTAVFTGIARRGDQETSFEIVVDSPEDRELLGIPFVAEIEAGARGALALRMDLTLPEGDTLLDGIDFEEIAGSTALASVTPENPTAQNAYNVFRRRFQTHDPYVITFKEPES